MENDKHYTRLKQFLKFDIENRDLSEQKDILNSVINDANDIKKDLNFNDNE